MIEIVHSDITRLAVDAIVNAANTTLLGGGGVDGAIHRAAGPELLAACRELDGCPIGEARLTPAFRLPARWVVHAVGPVWRGGRRGEAALLAQTYESALRLALAQEARSIAFPCISTGVYRFPKREAAHIALGVLGRHEHAFERIIVCCFGEEDVQLYREALGVRA
jgi:O-acetyl-ADP-ribose deacetylase (regulator of RNase III)